MPLPQARFPQVLSDGFPCTDSAAGSLHCRPDDGPGRSLRLRGMRLLLQNASSAHFSLLPPLSAYESLHTPPRFMKHEKLHSPFATKPADICLIRIGRLPQSKMDMDRRQRKLQLLSQLMQHEKKAYGVRPPRYACHNFILPFQHSMLLYICSYFLIHKISPLDCLFLLRLHIFRVCATL